MQDAPDVKTFPVAPRMNGSDPSRPKPHIGPDITAYKNFHQKTIGDQSDEWWAKTARETLYWYRDFNTIRTGSFERGDIGWFVEGQLNASYNCVDRWAFKHPDKAAIIYEADESADSQIITFSQLLHEVSRVANVLKSFGVKKGDTVSVYLPMTWHAVVAFLACARIGAIHSVVFAGFSAESLRDRVKDCECRVVITSDEGKRGGKTIATKAIVDAALKDVQGVEHVLVLQRTGKSVSWVEGRDKWWHEEVQKVRAYCPPEVMNAEDPLFILYTSGSTGKPKGVVHTTGGYLLGAALSVKYVFDVHPDDKFACLADVGWITGHTYIVYGPLAIGVTTTVFESTPVYPTPSRYWQTVDKYQLTHFYSAPTAIRLLRRLGGQHVAPYKLTSLRVLGSVGEPINSEAWLWYNEHVGRGHCSIVDTWWQTETGSIMVTPLPGAIQTKPGSATVPFWGVDPAIVEPTTGKVIEGGGPGEGKVVPHEGVLVIQKPWPSIARTIWRDHGRYLDTYMKPYPGHFFTGDGAARDEDGYIWIKGRVDDVINVSGHRLSTAEIESALILHSGVAETAVIGTADELTGQAVHAFVTLKPGFQDDSNGPGALVTESILLVRKTIGPFAAPKQIYLVSDLPKTRSGKIMRRILRKVVDGQGDALGDLSTLADPSVVDDIKKAVANAQRKKSLL